MILRKSVRARWVAALRSGDYRQAKQELAKPVPVAADGTSELGYCCLGVLCELGVASGAPDITVLQMPEGRKAYTVGDNERWTVTPPPHLWQWAGAGETYDPKVSGTSTRTMLKQGLVNQSTLMDANDGLGLSFDEIADLIENDPDRKDDLDG
jgi:hypothetical protein